MIRQFAYIHEVAGILLFLGKNIECSSIVFLSKKRHQNPNLQNNNFLYHAHRIHNGLQKRGKFFFSGGIFRTPRRLVHGHYDLVLLAQASAPWTKPQKISH